MAELDKALLDTKQSESEARQRLAVRRVIRDGEALLAKHPSGAMHFQVLEFLFRARQHLIVLDKDPEHRKALIEVCNELVKAPDDMAELRLEADLLLSQTALVKQGANAETRARALVPFVDRYVESAVGAKVLRMALVMALELGDSRAVADLHERIGKYFPADLEMIAFQRDKLGGQVICAPFCGSYERSDGKKVRLPMDALGRSTLLIFWSKDNEGMTLIKDMAEASKQNKDLVENRVEFVSVNLDELPDGGESIVRGLGVNWQVLRLPQGRKNPIYDAYVREDPRMLSISPTGLTALLMSGTSRPKEQVGTGKPDYGRMLGSGLAREWNEPRYVMQLRSLISGDFLVVDPEEGFNPTRPAEYKALAKGQGSDALTHDANCVPEATLKAIQDCFVLPPMRYRITHDQARENYSKAVDLCRKAIADHPQASDLWVVRNRLIVALMGLWKCNVDLGQLEAAIAEAKAALAAGYPKGCDVVARFCIARESLRDPAIPLRQTCDKLIADCGGDTAPGSALAAAAILSLDVADRASFEHYRKLILKDHTEYPMMWTFGSFLVDRHHEYWLFQVPFTAGWSYGRRQGYFMAKGDPEPTQRLLKTVLHDVGSKPFRIPEDLESEWTIILFSQPAPWNAKRDDGLPPSPSRVLQGFNAFAATRPGKDVKVMHATYQGDPEATRAALTSNKVPFENRFLTVPGGTDNPLLRRLGILSEDASFNTVLIHKDGRIALMISGLESGDGGARTLPNVVMRADEMSVMAALQRGDVQAAKDLILTLCPPFDPEAVDERGRKLRKPDYSLYHLRARARVYMALKEWDKALADAEEVVSRQLGTDGSMSLRTDELD
ncbi:MAG TPA: hypothetical protein VFY13_05070, partial [Luteolibacter sp.]|nr:hypothetical protein [Luteolibacter sp.]